MKGAEPSVEGQLAEGGPLGGYRPDIDGLRAIAVAAVVIFHAGVAGLPGGFVGVDIFFVISGYLIGGQMFREVENRQFSFATFYTRRVRRILPALFALLTVFLLVGLAIMTPEELKQFGKEATASIVGASNVLFYTGGGYFAPAADLQPLLMTWSLGVEEQFYLVFPFVVFLLVRTKAPPMLSLVVLSILAFAGSILLLHLNAKAAFYLLPTRSWELGIGAVLALWQRRHPVDALPRWLVETLSIAGLALLIASLTLYRPAFAFPGWFVVAPTLGTALLIAAPRSLISRRLLSITPMTFIGRVSYSWYLWHWPTFYVFRMLGGRFEGAAPLVLCVVTFAMAVVSWRFVEQPFRRRTLPRRTILLVYAGVGAALVGVMAMTYLSDGWPQRLKGPARSFAEAARTARDSACLAPYGERALRNAATCLPADNRPRLVVMGDSHASAIAPGFADAAARSGLAFGEMTKSSCPPLAGFAAEAADRPGHWGECVAYQKAAFKRVTEDPNIKTIVLAGFWSSGMKVRPADGAAGATTPLEDALVATVRQARMGGRRVILVKDVPSFTFNPYARAVGDLNPVRATAQAALLGGRAGGGMARGAEVRPDPSHAMIDSVARRTGAEVMTPADSLCEAAGCHYGDADRLYYFDFQHLTADGAAAAVRGFRP